MICSSILLGGCIQPLKTERLEVPPPESISTKAAILPFAPLTTQERQTPWGVEYYLGNQLAFQRDWYRAITAFKRADLLCASSMDRKSEIEYLMILCYYQAHKYLEAVHLFEKSSLTALPANKFAAFEDMILIICDSYHQIGQEEQATKLKAFLEQYAPNKAHDMEIYHQMSGAVPEPVTVESHIKDEILHEVRDEYLAKRKDPKKARILNAVLPGAGYWYLGQKETAVTAFLVNALFIATTYQFLHHGYTAAGILTGGLELGWYVGGINGVGLSAQEHNKIMYHKIVKRKLDNEKLFPIFSLSFSY